MEVSIQKIESALVESSQNPNFVPFVSRFKLGRMAFRYGLMVKDWWDKEVQSGWELSFNNCADGIALQDYKAAAAFVDSFLA